MGISLYQISWTEYSKDDYKKLDGSQKIFVDKAIDRIKIYGMNSGQRLSGNLAACNKLKNKRMGLRIIFKEEEGKVEVIQIVVIGKRNNNEVYKSAKSRL